VDDERVQDGRGRGQHRGAAYNTAWQTIRSSSAAKNRRPCLGSGDESEPLAIDIT
jgi:hypothetical protein